MIAEERNANPSPARSGVVTRSRALTDSNFWPLLVAGSCVLAALITTWPLATQLSTAVMLGTEHETTVQLFMIWTLWWNADRLSHLFSGYWDAPIFYPNPGAFTFSEPEPLTGLATAPLWALNLPPALIHNLALLAILTLNGIFAYRLVRSLRLPQLPALLAAMLTITLPFIAKVDGVLHLAPIFGILWTIEGLVRFGRDGRGRDAAWAATGFVVSYLTVQQYTLMFALFAGAAGLVALAQQRFKLEPLLRLAMAAIAAAAIVLFVAWPSIQLHGQYGFTRSEDLVQLLSARPADFITRPGTAWLQAPPGSWDATGGLFPGAILLVLALTGAALGWTDRLRGRWTIYLALSSIGAALFALGLNFNLIIWQPYYSLAAVLPGLTELRSPFRAAVIMQAMLPILAAITLSYMQRRAARLGVALILVVGLLGAAENLTLPVPLGSVPLSPATAWTTWLRAHPENSTIVHVPFPAGLSVTDYEIEGRRMFAQIDHGRPMVNGYSGFFPPGYTPFQEDMAQRFPTRDLICELARGIEVNTLIVDQLWLAEHQAQMDSQAAYLQQLYSDGEVTIYHILAPDAPCVTTPQP